MSKSKPQPKSSPIPLPETAQQIADIIGRNNTLALAAKVRHRKLYVPHAYPDGHFIVETIGEEAAGKLQFECRGLYLDLAKCHSIVVTERNASIRRDFKAGKATVPMLMQQHGLSLRAVRYALAGVDGKPSKGRAA